MSRMTDEEFRQMYAASERNKKEIADRMKKQYEEAALRSRCLRKDAESHRISADIHEASAAQHLKMAEEERTIAKAYIEDAEELETMEMIFHVEPDDFVKAITPVIRRSIKNYITHGKVVFEFLREDINLPMKTLNWKDTVAIRFQKDGEFVERGYLTYNSDWRKLRAEKIPATHYLQQSYQFELGDTTKFKNIEEGIEELAEYVTEF